MPNILDLMRFQPVFFKRWLFCIGGVLFLKLVLLLGYRLLDDVALNHCETCQGFSDYSTPAWIDAIFHANLLICSPEIYLAYVCRQSPFDFIGNLVFLWLFFSVLEGLAFCYLSYVVSDLRVCNRNRQV